MMMPAIGSPSESRDAFKRGLIDLVVRRLSSRRRGRDPVGTVDETTPLFESGLIDSLAVLELMAFIEEATGRPIPTRMIHMKHFATVDRICAAFWPALSPVEGVEHCEVKNADL
jgi:acyl carrier protein